MNYNRHISEEENEKLNQLRLRIDEFNKKFDKKSILKTENFSPDELSDIILEKMGVVK